MDEAAAAGAPGGLTSPHVERRKGILRAALAPST